MDPQRIHEANENAQKAKVDDRVQFLQQDLFQTDLSKATVVTLYLLPELNKKLRPRLLSQLKPGTRIVSHEFDMGEWKPQRVVVVQGPQQGEHVAAFPILNGAKLRQRWGLERRVRPEPSFQKDGSKRTRS